MSRSKIPRPLTPRQREVWEYIAMEVQHNGYPPSLREIGIRFDISSTNGVRTLLSAIEKKGYLKRQPYLSRGLEILKWPEGLEVKDISRDVTVIPLVGRVAAGTPLLAEQNVEGDLKIDRSLFPSGDGFGLRVQGDSMIHAGIKNGDIVLVRPGISLEAGSIVVAMIDDEATVKYYFPEDYGVRLEPANPDFQPIRVKRNTEGFTIVGKVVGLFRRY